MSYFQYQPQVLWIVAWAVTCLQLASRSLAVLLLGRAPQASLRLRLRLPATPDPSAPSALRPNSATAAPPHRCARPPRCSAASSAAGAAGEHPAAVSRFVNALFFFSFSQHHIWPWWSNAWIHQHSVNDERILAQDILSISPISVLVEYSSLLIKWFLIVVSRPLLCFCEMLQRVCAHPCCHPAPEQTADLLQPEEGQEEERQICHRKVHEVALRPLDQTQGTQHLQALKLRKTAFESWLTTLWCQQAGYKKKLWKKKPARRKRLREHVFCNKTQSKLLDKMTTSFWKRRNWFVNDPYLKYHDRVNLKV